MAAAIGEVFHFIAAAWGWLIDNILYINLVLSVVIIFFQRKDPKSVWLWLLALNFIPVFGFFLYLVLGQDYHKSKMFRVKEVEDRLWSSAKTQEKALQKEIGRLQDSPWRDYVPLMMYNLETSGAVLTRDNSVKIFTDGEEKFADLREELKRAEHYIHIQYYIIKNDEVFESIRPILEMKAREGVEVRVLYDGMGGRFMPKRVWKEMRGIGIKVGVFFPAVLGWLQLRANYRNHRKIVVIDGKIGYVGGFNIGKEYISHSPRFGYWRDTHLKITGSAVYSLQIRFALDWNYATKENLFKNGAYFGMEQEDAAGAEQEEAVVGGKEQDTAVGGKERNGADTGAEQENAADGKERNGAGTGVEQENAADGKERKDAAAGAKREAAVGGKERNGTGAEREGAAGRAEQRPADPASSDVMIQLVASGPDASDLQIRNNYLQLFNQARDHIYIQTPYFIPDDAVLSALKFAARSGVDVRLMIPCKPDHPFVYWASYSYLGDLLAAGARCYTYENGFLHAKAVMTDSLACCCGTANMDIRSFELNFEVNATIYDRQVTEEMEKRFRDDLKHSREVTPEDYRHRSLWTWFREQCCRLLSPLL